MFRKGLDGTISFNNPTEYLRRYLGSQGVVLEENPFHITTAETVENTTLSTSIQQSTETFNNIESL